MHGDRRRARLGAQRKGRRRCMPGPGDDATRRTSRLPPRRQTKRQGATAIPLHCRATGGIGLPRHAGVVLADSVLRLMQCRY
jgi:hypothetical protein